MGALSTYTVTLLALSRLNMLDLRSSPAKRLSLAGMDWAIFLFCRRLCTRKATMARKTPKAKAAATAVMAMFPVLQ